MFNALLYRFNNLRKQKYFNSFLFKSQKNYAFIGVGMHSLSTLYPILRHFNIRLKYICTKNSSWKKEMSQHFPDCVFTNSLKDILNDDEVEGVFLCSSPAAHFNLLSQLLKARKKVFVEKPPCQTFAELETLIELSNDSICKVGFQRRYWPGNKSLTQKIKTAKTYTYQFHFGSYVQGDVYTELFIHALDYCIFLFGDLNTNSSFISKDKTGVTIQLHAMHNNNVSGLIELSTNFSWTNPTDRLMVNCANELLSIQYPTLVEGELKPKRILNLPSERLMNQSVVNKKYFSTSNFIVPAIELNSLVLQGFYNEIETFIGLVEKTNSSSARNDLSGLKNLYEVIEKLKVKAYLITSA